MSEILLALAILALAGCSYFFAPRVELQRLTLDVAARANDDSPIAVDFVAVKDAELFKELAGLPASQWFANREQYRRDYRQQFAVWSLSWSRGSSSSRSRSPCAATAQLDFGLRRL